MYVNFSSLSGYKCCPEMWMWVAQVYIDARGRGVAAVSKSGAYDATK